MENGRRIVSPKKKKSDNPQADNSIDNSVDNSVDKGLRPLTLKEYVGQSKSKEKLKIFIQAARDRQEALDLSLIHI